jgi:hypothetical protein
VRKYGPFQGLNIASITGGKVPCLGPGHVSVTEGKMSTENWEEQPFSEPLQMGSEKSGLFF